MTLQLEAGLEKDFLIRLNPPRAVTAIKQGTHLARLAMAPAGVPFPTPSGVAPILAMQLSTTIKMKLDTRMILRN